jgi:hypothetical protein
MLWIANAVVAFAFPPTVQMLGRQFPARSQWIREWLEMLTHQYGRRFKREIASQPNAISTKFKPLSRIRSSRSYRLSSLRS